jgi:cobalamin synthase
MYSKMLFIVFSMALDTHPWTLLYCLAALAAAMLVLVLVDKPYRDEEGHEGMSHGDWQAALSQVLMLVVYGVSAVCLQDQEAQLAQNTIEMSDGVAFFAAVAGVGVVLVQFLAVAYAAHTSAGVAPAEEPKDVVDEAKDIDATTTENPATSFANEG